jgi:hypothetical protein
LIDPLQKEIETFEAPQNGSFYWMMGCLPLGQPISVKRAQLWAKEYEIKAWCYWEHVGEDIENWKNVKKFNLRPTLLKRKNLEPLGYVLHHLTRWAKFLFFHLFFIIFT